MLMIISTGTINILMKAELHEVAIIMRMQSLSFALEDVANVSWNRKMAAWDCLKGLSFIGELQFGAESYLEHSAIRILMIK